MTNAEVKLSSTKLSTQAPTFDIEAVRAWITLIHGTSPGLIHICSTGNWTGRAFTEEVDAADYVERLNAQGREGIYMRTTTLARPIRDEHSRGSSTDSLCLPGFAGDIDIAGPGHKHTVCAPDCPQGHQHRTLDLPPDVPTAASIITESGLPEPTVWVHSGGGLYPWWIFDTPIELGEHHGVDEVQEVSRKLQQIIKASAERLGWAYGAEVYDVARVLRIPGTVNRKDGLERPCRIIAETYNFATYEDLHAQIEQLYAQIPPPAVQAPRPTPVLPRNPADGLAPGDDFESRTGWDDGLLLGGAGWTLLYTRGNTYHWKRPGKTTPGISATTGRDAGRDRLYVFSSEADPFPVNEPITKFHAYALLHHAGSHSEAAAHLRRLGYGSRNLSSPPSLSLYDMAPATREFSPPQAPAPFASPTPAHPSPPTSVPTAAPVSGESDIRNMEHDYFRSDVGNAARMRDMQEGKFHYDSDRNTWLMWTGEVWAFDQTGAIERAAHDVTFAIIREARQLEATSPKEAARLYRHGEASQSNNKIMGMVKRFASMKGVTVPSSEFDKRRELITMANGVFNLDTKKLEPFNPTYLLTRRFNAAYRPEARCPRFEAFLEQILPDPQVRDYIQRAVGYTLAGRVDQRSLFVPWGEPGTGKSQFLIILRELFALFGATAAAATLRASRSGQTNDLHGLRGKRFVCTSETSDETVLDEELIKRLTGQDAIVSRNLYEKNQEWQPECAVWIATNKKPKLSVDDAAIWTRVKPIHFGVKFSTDPDAQNTATPGLGMKIAAEEADGIFNWILEGLRKYEESGLPEPQALKDSMVEYKLESDSVAQFLTDAIEEAVLVEDDKQVIKSSQIFAMYEQWCARNRMRPVGSRKFVARMSALDYERDHRGTWVWMRLGVGSAGMLGTFI